MKFRREFIHLRQGSWVFKNLVRLREECRLTETFTFLCKRAKQHQYIKAILVRRAASNGYRKHIEDGVGGGRGGGVGVGYT